MTTKFTPSMALSFAPLQTSSGRYSKMHEILRIRAICRPRCAPLSSIIRTISSRIAFLFGMRVDPGAQRQYGAILTPKSTAMPYEMRRAQTRFSPAIFSPVKAALRHKPFRAQDGAFRPARPRPSSGNCGGRACPAGRDKAIFPAAKLC